MHNCALGRGPGFCVKSDAVSRFGSPHRLQQSTVTPRLGDLHPAECSAFAVVVHNQFNTEHVGTRRSLKNCISHIDASHSRQPLVKGERLVRYEVNAVMARLFAGPGRKLFCHKSLYVKKTLGHRTYLLSKESWLMPQSVLRNNLRTSPMVICWQPLASRLPPKKFCYG